MLTELNGCKCFEARLSNGSSPYHIAAHRNLGHWMALAWPVQGSLATNNDTDGCRRGDRASPSSAGHGRCDQDERDAPGQQPGETTVDDICETGTLELEVERSPDTFGRRGSRDTDRQTGERSSRQEDHKDRNGRDGRAIKDAD
jgi:hypothetical protein